jgi:perosamine synthetase
MSRNPSRREFSKTVASAAAVGLAGANALSAFTGSSTERPALLGGKPVRTQPFPSWPVIRQNDEQAWKEVLASGKWCRLDGSRTTRFETEWAQTVGAKQCLATASGTTALFTTLNALGVGPGDEVIVPPYTFVATINVVMLQFALPVFVDTDISTFQIDANKIEAAITPRTRAILPVHLGGSPADLDKILAVAKAHRIPVLEDACQAHLGEWRNKKLGTLGAAGCFSFQASKNLNSGEGGCIVSDDDELMDVCRSFHNNGRGTGTSAFSYVRNGSNHRMTEFQGALLREQLARVEAQSQIRTGNAKYLTRHFDEIAGISPARLYEGCTRSAYHLYMFGYDSEGFAGLPRQKFIKALAAEGIPASSGYTPLNKEPFIENIPKSRHFQKCFSETELSAYRERIQCPVNEKLCEKAVWFTQTMLLGPREDMNQIVDAVRKIQKHASELKTA